MCPPWIRVFFIAAGSSRNVLRQISMLCAQSVFPMSSSVRRSRWCEMRQAMMVVCLLVACAGGRHDGFGDDNPHPARDLSTCPLVGGAGRNAEGAHRKGPPSRLFTRVSSGRLTMGVRYRGGQFFLFGQVPPETTEVVSILQSARTMPAHWSMKRAVGPVWLALDLFEVTDLPEVYLVNLGQRKGTKGEMRSVAVRLAALDRVLAPYGGVGYSSLGRRMRAKRLWGNDANGELTPLFAGICRRREAQRLYGLRPDTIRIMPDGLFYESFPLPDAAPDGRYRITTYTLSSGRLLQTQVDQVTIQKQGFEGWLARVAYRRPFLYGLAGVLFAVSLGLAADRLCGKREPGEETKPGANTGDEEEPA